MSLIKLNATDAIELMRKGELTKFTGSQVKTVYVTDGRPYIFEDDKMLPALRSMIQQNK